MRAEAVTHHLQTCIINVVFGLEIYAKYYWHYIVMMKGIVSSHTSLDNQLICEMVSTLVY